jgi:hypothetical protein
MDEKCYWTFCFVPQASNAPIADIFTFAEYLAALALLVVLYTITDFRYRFRLSITPGFLYQTTFAVIVFVGFGSLISELWSSEGWWVLRVSGLNFPRWQTALGVLFLGTFLTWAWYAFLRPPMFSSRNARRFAQGVYRAIVKGSDEELSILASELSRSADSMLKICAEVPRRDQSADTSVKKPKPYHYAHDLLMLIANRKLCRHIIASSPGTAMAFFDATARHRAFSAPLEMFATMISAEAIENTDSILHHEDDQLHDGLMGRIQPWRTAVFGNYELLEALSRRHGSPLHISYKYYFEWKSAHWNAYAGVTLTAWQAYLDAEQRTNRSWALSNAFDVLERGLSSISQLRDNDGSAWRDDRFESFEAVTEFYRAALEKLDNCKKPPRANARMRDAKRAQINDVYDDLANLGFEILSQAATVRSSADWSWTVQHNTAWVAVFEGFRREGKPSQIVSRKLRRKIVGQIARMAELPNYPGARLLGLLINVLGPAYKPKKTERGQRDMPRRLANIVNGWLRENYLKLRAEYPDVAKAVLVGGISFDEEHSRLTKTYATFLGKPPRESYLELDT